MLAPSAGGLQDFRFIVSTDKEVIQKLPELCMDQAWISSAPGIIVVCSQPAKQENWYGERGKHVFSIQNAAAATQNILLAAQDLGLGACWVGGFDQDAVDKLFKAEGKARVEAIITIGYTAYKPDKRHVEDISTMLFFDSYGNNKPDPVGLNKDYSIKIEKKLKQTKEQTKDTLQKAKMWGTYLSKKLNENVQRYKIKK